MDFSSISIIELLFSAGIAAFIQRVSGFGFGIFIMTILPYLLPSYGEAVTLSGLMAMTQSIYVLIKMRNFIVLKRVIPMLSIFLLISYFCIGYITKFDNTFLMHILGATLILLSLYFLFFSSKIRIGQSLPMQLGMGTISGVMGGFFGMQGPPAVLYFVESEPDKNHYVAQTQLYFAAGNLFMAFVRAKNGFLTPTVGYGYLIGISAVAIGTYLGTKVFSKISEKKLKIVIYTYMAISGIIALLK